MTIKITFTGSNWSEIEAQLQSYRTPSAAPSDPTPDIDDVEDTPEDAALIRAHVAKNPGAETPPPPEPKAKRGRPRLPTIPEIIAATEPEPEPAAPKAAREIPTLDMLKATVTQAVRQAQKKEGPAKILELLPAFKAKTGLEYIMNSTEAHREALFELVEEAGL